MQSMSSDVDRISSLTDPLLHQIFSFLPTKNVVQTCILSKRWIDLWCSAPFIDFHLDNEDHVGFIKLADGVLLHRDGSNVQSFRLNLPSPIRLNSKRVYITRIFSWIIFALKHNVEILDVKLFEEELIPGLPPRLFISTSLKELKLDFDGYLKLPDFVCLPNLHILVLKWMIIEDHGPLSQILSSSSFLHTLSLCHCIFLSEGRLTISTPQLETLECLCVREGPFIEISAPRLVSLKVILLDSSWSIHDCPSLVAANIKLDGEVPSSESMEQLIKFLSEVESMKVCHKFIVACSEYIPHLYNWIQTPFKRLTFLKLTTFFSKKDIQLINILLSFCPNVESLFLRNMVEVFDLKPKDSVPEWKGEVEPKEKLSHLKFVKFLNFRGSKNEVKFVEHLFNKAPNFGKLIIMARRRIEDSEKRELLADITRMLVIYPQVTRISIDASRGSVSCSFV